MQILGRAQSALLPARDLGMTTRGKPVTAHLKSLRKNSFSSTSAAEAATSSPPLTAGLKASTTLGSEFPQPLKSLCKNLNRIY
jgi:hypothetical protein